MKNLMDRIIPVAEPFINLRNGHCYHPVRPEVKGPKIVLVSNCGFWEMDNFDPLLAQMEAFCRIQGLEFAGALLRPHGPALAVMLRMGVSVGDVLEAAREAGRQLAGSGVMSPETLKIVSRQLLPLETYLHFTNQEFQQKLDALTPKTA
jgi:hypothetical protein